MKTIWKYELPITDAPEVRMPSGARILSCGLGRQNETILVWAEVNPDNPPTPCGFRIVGTGHPMPGVGEYVGTVQDVPFVWHIYEEEA